DVCVASYPGRSSALSSLRNPTDSCGRAGNRACVHQDPWPYGLLHFLGVIRSWGQRSGVQGKVRMAHPLEVHLSSPITSRPRSQSASCLMDKELQSLDPPGRIWWVSHSNNNVGYFYLAGSENP